MSGAIMSFWRDYRLIFRYAVYHAPRRWPIAIVVFGLLAASVALPLLLMTSSMGWHKVIGIGVGLPLGMLLFLGWSQLMRGAAKLNTPANAQLVPRMRKRLIQVALLTWLAGTTLATLVYGFDTGNYGWCFVLLGFYAMGCGVSAAGQTVGALISMASIAFFTFSSYLSPALHALLWGDAALAIGALALLPTGGYCMTMAFPRGGDGHWRTQGKLTQTAQAEQQVWTGGNLQSLRSISAIYVATLRRDCGRRLSDTRLIAHVLGPACHWSASAGVIGTLLGLGVLARLWLIVYADSDASNFVGKLGGFLISPLLFLQFMSVRRYAASIAATRAEQALFRLSPRLASPASLNRVLAGALLRAALLDWLALTAMIVALSLLIGAPFPMQIMLVALCCLSLPLTGVPLRDYARDDRPENFWSILGGVFAFATVVFLLLLFPTIRHAGRTLISLSLLGVCIAGAVAIALSRWRTMTAAPAAFPSGRLAR